MFGRTLSPIGSSKSVCKGAIEVMQPLFVFPQLLRIGRVNAFFVLSLAIEANWLLSIALLLAISTPQAGSDLAISRLGS